MVAVVVHAIGFRLDAEKDSLRCVAGRRDCHFSALGLVGQRQCDGLSAVGNAVGDILGVHFPCKRASSRDVGGNDGICDRAVFEIP